jgi:anti-anti-sigma regulatory factor
MKIESGQKQLQLSGTVFIQESNPLIVALKALLQSGETQVQIDLDQVEAIDTGILQIFLAAQQSAEQIGKTIQFSPISAQVMRILDQTGLEPLFSMNAYP